VTPLASFSVDKFDSVAMSTFAGAAVAARFKECFVTGSKTSPEDAKAIEKALFDWCSSRGCINYAHWCALAARCIWCVCVVVVVVSL